MEKIALNANEVANLLGISRGFVYELVKNNNIPYKKLQNRVLFPKETIEKWLLEEN